MGGKSGGPSTANGIARRTLRAVQNQVISVAEGRRVERMLNQGDIAGAGDALETAMEGETLRGTPRLQARTPGQPARRARAAAPARAARGATAPAGGRGGRGRQVVAARRPRRPRA